MRGEEHDHFRPTGVDCHREHDRRSAGLHDGQRRARVPEGPLQLPSGAEQHRQLSTDGCLRRSEREGRSSSVRLAGSLRLFSFAVNTPALTQMPSRAPPKAFVKVAAPPAPKPHVTAVELLQQALGHKRMVRTDLTRAAADEIKYEPEAKGHPHSKMILVVEDDDDTRELLIRILGTEYTVYAALHGKMALAMLKQIP